MRANTINILSFSADENPIFQNGLWVGGGVTGLDWTNVQTRGGLAFGSESGSTLYDDSTAVLSGVWGPDQIVRATIHSTNQPTAPNVFEEVELRLRTTVAPHSITGYEVNFSCSANANNLYSQIVVWNGPVATALNPTFTQIDGDTYHCADGDVVEARAIGSVISVYVNGTFLYSAQDTTFNSGNPGMGFYLAGATGLNSDYGFTSFFASDGLSQTPEPSSLLLFSLGSSGLAGLFLIKPRAGQTNPQSGSRNESDPSVKAR